MLSLNGSASSLAELPVFDGGVYPASVAELKDSEVISISRNDFRSLCLERPEVALKLLEVVEGRLRRLVSIIEELSFTKGASEIDSLLAQTSKNKRKTNYYNHLYKTAFEPKN